MVALISNAEEVHGFHRQRIAVLIEEDEVGVVEERAAVVEHMHYDNGIGESLPAHRCDLQAVADRSAACAHHELVLGAWSEVGHVHSVEYDGVRTGGQLAQGDRFGVRYQHGNATGIGGHDVHCYHGSAHLSRCTHDVCPAATEVTHEVDADVVRSGCRLRLHHDLVDVEIGLRAYQQVAQQDKREEYGSDHERAVMV